MQSDYVPPEGGTESKGGLGVSPQNFRREYLRALTAEAGPALSLDGLLATMLEWKRCLESV